VTATEIASILVAIAAVLGALVTYRKYRPETRASEADTAAKYQQVADLAAERALKLDARVQQLEGQVAAQRELIDEQQQELHTLRCENDDLRDWAERLVSQVKSLGGDPVRVRAREKTEPRPK